MQLPTVIVLASGQGERFRASGGSGNKLHALLGSQRVIDWTIDAVHASGLPFHVEDAGHAGMGDSIAAAVLATRASAGWLVLPADLPLIKASTLALVAQTIAEGAPAAYPVHGGQRGHPVGFAASCGPMLQNLKGNQGAARIFYDFDAIKLVVDDRGCVADIDTLADLQRAVTWLPTIGD